MEIYAIRAVAFILIALGYMLFDVFNNRNVPNVFAYATLALGFAMTMLYLNYLIIMESVLIAVAVLGLGYFVYRIGQLGAADVIELAALSLILPFLDSGLLYYFPQGYMPVAISLAINSGIAALIIVPLYYIPKALKHASRNSRTKPEKADYFKTALIITVYAFFAAFLYLYAGMHLYGLALLILIALGSALVIFYEKPMMAYMVQYVSRNGIEPGDIIATAMLSDRETASLRKKLKQFDRLVSEKLVKEMKAKKFSRKLPVYKKPIPFAVPIFIGAVAAILLGNALFLLFGAAL